MNIPTIGGAHGIFEIFIPGMFLLLNLVAVVYTLPFTDTETKNLISAIASNSALVLVIVIGFGYLIGILLRLLRPTLPDRWSAAWLRRFHSKASPKKGEFKAWAIEDFPYIGWMGETCQEFLPPEAQVFYDKFWAPRKCVGENKSFFNYCKVMINSNDERAASEIYVAESLTRYISGMFYALLFAFILVLVTVVLRYFMMAQLTVGLVIILVGYLIAMVEIVIRFRFVRIKEVETVFAACFRNQEMFQAVSQHPLSEENVRKKRTRMAISTRALAVLGRFRRSIWG